ncbi:HEAT repeat domain-containing protein [Tautonia plasticadhaerens]|uniref:Putative lyase n=1 Tax=Tautonia plasticadhaerens TaxID=2527974 RepID=A0A518H1S6_9BACT|nr:HEAT repeat domain-containing protein [Tautonia plasticadhaerens]QDV34780.1 putative lyase [Tautonia plasticadhaerens]
MSVAEKHLAYRGRIRALAASGKMLLFVTEHPEGRPTSLYRLDCETFDLASDPIPGGGRALCLSGDEVWVAASDGSICRCPISGGSPSTAMSLDGEPASALSPLQGDRLAIAAGPTVVIADVSKPDARPIQSLDLPAAATALAADPTGRWLVAGTARGDVSVFTAEGREEFILSESARVHEGAVTALAFEPDELRFLSAGADRALRSTLARGALEPEDRGRSFGHDDAITAIAWAPGDRFLTGSLDSTVKTWPRSGGARPGTLKDGVAKVRGLAVVSVHDRPRLSVACEDDTIRLFVLDAAGKFGDPAQKIHGALSRARRELAEGDPRRREHAIADLASANDLAALDLLAEHSRADADPGLRLDAARRIGDSDHPRSVPLLEGLLGHPDEAVRLLAFDRLRDRAGEADFRPIDLALKTGLPEIGRRAVEALAPRSKQDDQALDRLLAALDAKEWEVRRSAAEALESIHPADSPEADLIVLGTSHADLRRWALIRLLHRGLLGQAAVSTSLRRMAEDRDADVRRVAFLLMLHTRPRLVEAIRAGDADLARQLDDLDAALEGQGGAAGPPAGRSGADAKAKPPKKGARGKAGSEAPAGLDAEDLAPLLNAAASRSLDTSLRGARCLALLGDPRAFGLLLQLSREAEPSARVEVCRALANLGDAAAVSRLRSLLHDEAAEVRDAAFTAIASIDREVPLLAAGAGLDADHDDVRRRGLQLLLAEAKKAPPASAESPTGLLLVRALNDGSPALRAEAFKAVLNLPAAGGGAGALRFARRSIHADVRREVLTEALAQLAEPWAWDLLLGAFDDPDPALRADALDAARKKSKGLDVLEAALGCRHADLRLEAVAGLVKTHTAAAQALLVRAIDDEDPDVRRSALDALVSDDATAPLSSALGSPHAEIRGRAARALARLGDRAALGPLVALAAAPEPVEEDRRDAWLAQALIALDGLAELGDPEAVVPVLPMLDSPHAPLRKWAAAVLCWCAEPDATGPLRLALSHADPQVRYRAAMGLALRGDASVAPMLDSAEGAEVLGLDDRLAVLAALGDPGEPRLVVSLDDGDQATRNRALLLLLCRELKAPRGDASRRIAALSSRSPRVRLAAADALRSGHDPAGLLATVSRLVNDRGGQSEASWSVPEATVSAMADLLAIAPPIVRARAASRLLPTIDPGVKESAALELACSALLERFAPGLDRAKADAPPSPAPTITPEALLERAFGAYVGLAREQGEATSKGKKGRPSPTNVASQANAARVRRSALDRLRALADSDPSLVPAVVPVLVQALGDPSQEARLAAFDHLVALGLDATTLGAEALASGQTDVGTRGLERLRGASGDDDRGRSVLDQVMMSRKDDLAVEAARLLADRLGRPAVAAKAIESGFERLRLLAVSWLDEAVDSGDEPARDALRGALDSRYAAVRRAAALALADRKDPAAFEALVRLLGAAVDRGEQIRIVAALELQGDPRAPGALLDRLERDPAGTAAAEVLIPAAGRFRRPEDADRLLALMDLEKKWRPLAFDALLALSGHDQPVEDPNDDRPDDRRWMESQHSRRDGILASILDRCLSLGEPRLLQRAISPARWALGPEVDGPLALASSHPDDGPRHLALRAIGWRLRTRSGPAGPLLRALQHPDPTSQFLAAEGLALGDRPEGLSVLLSAVDFLQDLALRRRAVVALGELGDPRAFDRLLQLASEDGHALQDVAAEAIGHLGRSGQSARIYSLLDRQSRSPGSVSETALKGLRWLGTPEAWARIREVAGGGETRGRAITLDLLGHDDEPATRDLLRLHLRSGEELRDLLIALRSARRLFGDDSLEPDEAVLQNPNPVLALCEDWDLIRETHGIPLDAPLDRLRERGDPSRLFELLPRCPDMVADALGSILLDLPAPPPAEVRAAVASDHARTVAVAARILGRTRDPGSGPAISEALATWTSRWAHLRETIERGGLERSASYPVAADSRGIPGCLSSLAWASGRVGTAAEGLAALVAMEIAGSPIWTGREILLATAEALVLFDDPPPAVLDSLESIARDGPPELRTLAAAALARRDRDRASRLGPGLIVDPVGFGLLADALGDALDPAIDLAAGRLHEQGVAVPVLVTRKRIDTLATVAADRSLPDATRLGAVEGLAAIASEAAEEHLRRVGLDEQTDEELRKAAWRALRRSRRARSRKPRRVEVTP